MKFDEIYKPPFHEVLDFWVYTQGDVRCFDWIARLNSRTRKELIRILNGNSKKRVKIKARTLLIARLCYNFCSYGNVTS